MPDLQEETDLEPDTMENILNSINYLPEQALLNFENDFSGFNSLRAKVHNEVNEWFEAMSDSNDYNPEEDPDYLYYVADDAIRTVLNEYGEVMIDDTLMIILNSGSTYLISDNYDGDARDALRNGIEIDESAYSNVFKVQDEQRDVSTGKKDYSDNITQNCKSWDSDEDPKFAIWTSNGNFIAFYIYEHKLKFTKFGWGIKGNRVSFKFRHRNIVGPKIIHTIDGLATGHLRKSDFFGNCQGNYYTSLTTNGTRFIGGTYSRSRWHTYVKAGNILPSVGLHNGWYSAWPTPFNSVPYKNTNTKI